MPAAVRSSRRRGRSATPKSSRLPTSGTSRWCFRTTASSCTRVGALAGFIVRLVGYALALGIVARVASALWVQYGLDGSSELQPFHDLGFEILVIAPLP